MSWLLAIALALGAFAVAAFAFRIGRQAWTTFAAALALGLAGYALQASPDIPGAPAQAAPPQQTDWSYVEARQEMVGTDRRSSSNKMIIADGLARRGQYANAVALLRAAVTENPRDGEAWLALGNALVEHSDGALTEPAVYAYRQAAEIDPEGTGPGYFLGLALIRQGRLPEARGLWQATLEGASEDAAGRAALAERIARLDQLLSGAVTVPQPDATSR